jgi:hypothetical protein
MAAAPSSVTSGPTTPKVWRLLRNRSPPSVTPLLLLHGSPHLRRRGGGEEELTADGQTHGRAIDPDHDLRCGNQASLQRVARNQRQRMACNLWITRNGRVPR